MSNFCNTHFFFNKFWRYTTIKELLINNQITVDPVRLIGADGTQLGIVELAKAKSMAYDEDLDLVLLTPNAKPPVCKIMDYGKHRFDTMKRARDARKKQKTTEVKGMQLSLNIQDHDMQFKARNVRKFLLAGDKVKVSLRLFGRQLASPGSAMPIMEKFFELVSDISTITSKPEQTGRQIVMVLSPISAKK